jgi:hypothetical protein
VVTVRPPHDVPQHRRCAAHAAITTSTDKEIATQADALAHSCRRSGGDFGTTPSPGIEPMAVRSARAVFFGIVAFLDRKLIPLLLKML